jgi:hypothetical protein
MYQVEKIEPAPKRAIPRSVRRAFLNGLVTAVEVIVLTAWPMATRVQASNAIASSEASSHVGEQVTVCGFVADARFVPSSRGKPTYLNFDRPFPDHSFAVVIFGKVRGRWDQPPEDTYSGRRTCARGMIGEYRGKPQIIANTPSQIWLGEDSEPSATEPIGEGSLRVILLSPIAWERPSTECRTEACVALVKLIDGALTQISFAVYGLRGQPTVLEALGRAQQRGVLVRGIVDKALDGTSYYEDTDDLNLVASIRTDWEADKRTAQAQRPRPTRKDRCPRPDGFGGPLQCLWYDLGEQCLLAAHASRDPLQLSPPV